MVFIIVKETKREHEAARAEKLARNPSLRGKVDDFVRTADEANDRAYHTHGEQKDPYFVEGGTERRQAFIDDANRLGQQIGKPMDAEKLAHQWKFDLKEGKPEENRGS